MTDSETEKAGEFRQIVKMRQHEAHADVGEADGGHDSAPSPHDFFDAALAACTTTTAHWYAKKFNIPLERAEAHVERDDKEERHGTYRLKLRVDFHGPISDEQRQKLHDVVTRCPIHKLMTTSTVEIETVESLSI